MQVNVLSFNIEPLNPPAEMALAAVPVIDGRPRTDLVAEFEANRGFQPAGGYGGLVFEYFDFGPLSEYFDRNETISVLGCDCGEVGCWPLMCRIKADGDSITWHSFLQPHRSGRDYSGFGPFSFDTPQYLSAVFSLQENISRAH